MIKTWVYRPDKAMSKNVYTNLCYDVNGNTLNDFYDNQNFNKSIIKDIKRQECLDAYFENKNKKISIEC